MIFYQVMSDDDLQHHGILGQKWGVRRYQNKDGSLTSEGKARLGYDGSSGDRTREKVNSDVRKAVSSDYKSLSSGANAAKDLTVAIKNRRNDRAAKKAAQAARNMDLSKITDADLQKLITRFNLENSYRSLVAKDVVSGRDKLNDVLDVAGSILAVGASAAAIGVAIHQIKS